MYLGQGILYFVVFLTGVFAARFVKVIVYCYRQKVTILKLFKVGNFFPLFSFILNKGKQCVDPESRDDSGKSIFFRLGPVELCSAGIFVVCFYFFGPGVAFLKYAVILELLLVISIVDLETGIIPNRFLLWLFLWILLWQVIRPYLPLESVILGFLTGGVLFYVIALLSRGGMGGGDIKLMAVLGFAVGVPYVLVLFIISFVLGALAGIVLLAWKKRVLKDSLPFAPFLALGFFLVIFWGVKLWHWYVSFW